MGQLSRLLFRRTTQVTVGFGTLVIGGTGLPQPGPPVLASVTYAGPAPDEVAGVYQIDARVPPGVTGSVNVALGSAGTPMASAQVNVFLSSGP